LTQKKKTCRYLLSNQDVNSQISSTKKRGGGKREGGAMHRKTALVEREERRDWPNTECLVVERVKKKSVPHDLAWEREQGPRCLRSGLTLSDLPALWETWGRRLEGYWPGDAHIGRKGLLGGRRIPSTGRGRSGEEKTW